MKVVSWFKFMKNNEKKCLGVNIARCRGDLYHKFYDSNEYKFGLVMKFNKLNFDIILRSVWR